MKPEERMLVEAVRHASGGSEWIDAAAVHRRLPEGLLSQAAVARRLPALAEDRHVEMQDDGVSKRYRVRARSVAVYDDDGAEAGRLVMWLTAGGLELDLSQLAEMLPAHRWGIELFDRDLRTTRAAVDEALWNVGRR